MTVPTPTSEFLDLTTATFTANGSPLAIVDQHSATDVTFAFDGSDDFLTTSVEPIAASSGAVHSFSCWVKLDTQSQGQTFIGQIDTSTSNQRVFVLSSGTAATRLTAQFLTTDADLVTSQVASGTDDWDDSIWHHIAVTVNGNALDIYIDGTEASSYFLKDSTSGGGYTGAPATGTALSVGASNNGVSFLDGSVSRLKFWEGTELIAAEVLEEFNNECDAVVAPTPTLSVDDLSGWTNTGATAFVNDQHTSASSPDFDGVNDRLAEPTSDGIFTIGVNQASFSGWVRIPTLTGQEAICTNLNAFDGTSQNKGALFVWADSSGRLGCTMYRDTNNNTQSQSDSNLVTDGAWHHIVTTVEANDVNLYIDGVEVVYRGGFQNLNNGSGFTTGFAGTGGSPETMKLGGNTQQNLEGIVSRPRWWDGTTLSPCQITKIFNTECDAAVLPSPDFEDLDLSDGWTPAGGVTFEDDLWNTGAAFVGNGSDTVQRQGEIITTGNEQTVSFWFKTTGSSASPMIAQYFIAGADLGTFQIVMNSDGSITSWWIFGSSGNRLASQSSSTYDDGAWHHCSAVVANNNTQIFVDNVEATYSFQNSKANVGYVDTNNSSKDITIGSYDDGVQWYTGSLTRPKIWLGTALSPCQQVIEFTAECEAVTMLPTPVFLSANMANTSDWAQTGSPSFTAGPFFADTALDADGTNDLLSKADNSGIYSSGETTFSVSAWVKLSVAPAGQRAIIANNGFNTSGNGGIFFWTNASGIIACNAYNDNTNFVSSVSNEDILDGEYHYITAVGSLDTIRLYIDAVEVTYATKDDVTGGGFASGFNGDPNVMEVAGTSGFFEGAVARTTFWLENLNTCQLPLQFEAEEELGVLAALQASFFTEGIIERLNEWESTDPSLSIISTLTVPFSFGTVLNNSFISGQVLTAKQIEQLDDWGNNDPALTIVGDFFNPFLFGSFLDDAMSDSPTFDALTDEQITTLNDWEIRDPGLFRVQTLQEGFNLGDMLNALQTR